MCSLVAVVITEKAGTFSSITHNWHLPQPARPGDAPCAGRLNHFLGGPGIRAEQDRDAHQAFRTDEPDLDHCPVGQGRHHGNHPLLDEVDMIDGLVSR